MVYGDPGGTIDPTGTNNENGGWWRRTNGFVDKFVEK